MTRSTVASQGDDRRWTEINGIVESLVGRTLVIRTEDGRVSIDVSGVSESVLDRMVRPGVPVKVYGVPEMRFKAMGFVDPRVAEPRTRR